MPHLDANALENDPEGMAFLRDVLGKRSAQGGSWSGPRTETKKGGPVPLLEVGLGQCRWPLWTDAEPEKLVCGDPALFGKSYCAAHARRAWVQITSAASARRA